jgi:hypothetical protein
MFLVAAILAKAIGVLLALSGLLHALVAVIRALGKLAKDLVQAARQLVQIWNSISQVPTQKPRKLPRKITVLATASSPTSRPRGKRRNHQKRSLLQTPASAVQPAPCGNMSRKHIFRFEDTCLKGKSRIRFRRRLIVIAGKPVSRRRTIAR